MSTGPIQLLKRDEDSGRFVLNESDVIPIFDHEDVRDCNLSIISIGGALRKGKSFMLRSFCAILRLCTMISRIRIG